MKRDYTVSGMTCEHCVQSVREEVSGVRGVDDVEVELASGRVSVSGSGFADDDVRGAVEDAGYRLAS
jgi:copper chaperone CopZ